MAKSQLPKAIRKQIRASEKIAKEAGLMDDEGNVIPPDNAGLELVVNPDDPLFGDDTVTAEGSENEEDPTTVEGGEPAPAVVEDPPAQGQELELEPDKINWEGRYAALQGKYNAEVPRMHAEIQTLHGDLENMRAIVAGVKTPGDSTPGNGSDPKPAPAGLTQDDIDEFGEDLIEIARKVARDEFGPVIDQQKAEILSLRGQMGNVSQHVATTQQNSVYEALDNTIEGWRELNHLPEFHKWLEQVDPLSGFVRGQLLRSAFDRKDANRVIAFFDGYLDENTDQAPASEARTIVTDEMPSQTDLETLAAPGRSGAQTDARQQKRLWTQAEISAFYRDVQRGKYREHTDAQRRIEKDIVAAGQEGRVQVTEQR